MELARELRGEAQRLNASLAVPESRGVASVDGSEPSTARPERPPGAGSLLAETLAPARERRFAPPSERASAQLDGEAEPGELPISDGARLLITNMALLGSSREEILGMMRDELGLENPDAILEQLRL